MRMIQTVAVFPANQGGSQRCFLDLDRVCLVVPVDESTCRVYFGDGGIQVNLSAENLIDRIQNPI